MNGTSDLLDLVDLPRGGVEESMVHTIGTRWYYTIITFIKQQIQGIPNTFTCFPVAR